MRFSLPEDALIHDWKRRLVFWSGAISVGLVAILLAVACEWSNGVSHKMLAISPYLPLVVTPLGLALIVCITRKYFPGSQGSGIPQTIASLAPRADEQIGDRPRFPRVQRLIQERTEAARISATRSGKRAVTVV